MQAGARIQLTVHPVADAIPTTRKQLLAWARQRLAKERSEDFELLASEALTNAILHGDGSSPIQIEAWIENHEVCLQIVNRAQRFEPPVYRSGEGGLGLPIIARAADRWGVERDQDVRLWFCFRSGEQPQAAS